MCARSDPELAEGEGERTEQNSAGKRTHYVPLSGISERRP